MEKLFWGNIRASDHICRRLPLTLNTFVNALTPNGFRYRPDICTAWPVLKDHPISHTIKKKYYCCKCYKNMMGWISSLFILPSTWSSFIWNGLLSTGLPPLVGMALNLSLALNFLLLYTNFYRDGKRYERV